MKLEDGSSVKLNPRYEAAQFELAYCDAAKNIIKAFDPYPARFETKEAAMEFMAGATLSVTESNSKFKKLAVPYFLVFRPDGTTYESW